MRLVANKNVELAKDVELARGEGEGEGGKNVPTAAERSLPNSKYKHNFKVLLIKITFG